MSTPTSVPSALGDGRATIEPGRRVAGRYLLLAPVGRGGSGAVWRAHDELLDRDVAIKRLHGGRALDPARARQVRERAHREGRVAARLHHPRLAAIFDMIELDGEICLVMEYVAAPSLADLLDHEGPLPPARVAAIGTQIAEGLAAMHDRGIVHRDVKPANIMIGAGDVVTVTDFGIAVVDTDPGTSDQLVAGTPHYMAPELARGGTATAAADVFSLGATLYTALEGRPPAGEGGNALEVLSRVATGLVQPTRRAGDLTPVVRMLLDHDPARRPLAAVAARLLAGEDVSAQELAATALPGTGHDPEDPSRAGADDGADDEVDGADHAAPTGPIALPVPARPTRTRPVTSPAPSGTTRRRPGRRAVAVGAGLVGVLGAAGVAGAVAARSDTADPVPVAAPEAGVPLAATPVPVAAPPVIPAAPSATPSTTSRTTVTSTPMEEAASSRSSESRAERQREASRRAAASWERWWERWRDQARAERGNGNGNGNGNEGRGRGRGGGRDG
ncbi:serine/threonine-protein kinase [Actinomycetospora cinnamomea]|uniref:non-specific serine/threonine protein kinase n=1 Tax=Actinomycetospora cinnamomea TaxID=663609 RepID=A0A2U1FA64_9PSEU|nr:serine/threonine-protein kinase [Actinomycetospora cinnamomea]PVZ09083.1 serine/threonine protein kinase [Actinomycetospora cinnamomea]